MIKAVFTYADGRTQTKEMPDGANRFYGVKLNGRRPVEVDIWGPVTFAMANCLRMSMCPLGHTTSYKTKQEDSRVQDTDTRTKIVTTLSPVLDEWLDDNGIGTDMLEIGAGVVPIEAVEEKLIELELQIKNLQLTQ